MVFIPNTKQQKVLSELSNTHDGFGLCSFENLARIKDSKTFSITNKSRFWNDRCEEILHTWNDTNKVFHYFPENYQKKMIASREFGSLFLTQILVTLENDLDSLERKKKKKKQLTQDEEQNYVMLLKLYSKFFNIGLAGIERLVPTEFHQIIYEQVESIKTLMRAIDSYTQRLAPNQVISSKFPFEKQELGL